jgi:hypothetical protein
LAVLAETAFRRAAWREVTELRSAPPAAPPPGAS